MLEQFAWIVPRVYRGAMQDQASVARQYQTDENLRIRVQTHERYGVGESLEGAVDRVAMLHGAEDLLDVGTGPGTYPIRLRRENHRGRLVGVDSSPGMIAKAAASDSHVQFLVANAQSLPFPDASFDLVTARHMLYHVAGIPQALRQIHRVLRTGGRLLAVTNAQNYMSAFWDIVAEAAGDDHTFLPLLKARGSQVFNEHSGAAHVEAVFGSATVAWHRAELVFPDSEPAVRYLASCRTICEVDDAIWQTLLLRVRDRVDQHLTQGPWHVTRNVVLITAQKQ